MISYPNKNTVTRFSDSESKNFIPQFSLHIIMKLGYGVASKFVKGQTEDAGQGPKEIHLHISDGDLSST
nr:hypothetical protein Iba_chr04bCG5450 [Ipomoea batatas]